MRSERKRGLGVRGSVTDWIPQEADSGRDLWAEVLLGGALGSTAVGGVGGREETGQNRMRAMTVS